MTDITASDDTAPSVSLAQAIGVAVKGRDKDAPTITESDIDDVIVGENYYVFPESTLTVCCLTLANGFTVTGESACVSKENFDPEKGKDYARRKARSKVWELEGYLLREYLAKREDDIERRARIAHEINRAYCLALGDRSQPAWEDAPDWQRRSAIAGVKRTLAGDTPEQLHEAWCAFKRAEGWVHGKTKDPHRKTHPCLAPYDELPVAQRIKDHLFRAAVLSAY